MIPVAVALAMRGTGTTLRADVVDVLRLQREPGDVARELHAWQRKHGMAPLHIEASRDGKSIARALRSIEPGLRLSELAPRGDKFVRAQPVATAWNEGRVRVPASSQGASWLGPFLDTVCRFTGVSDRHDDDVDALAAWLRDRVADFQGPLTLDLFQGGQSNPTYRLTTPRASYVMRAKPGPADLLEMLATISA